MEMIEFNSSKLLIVPINQVRANTWNPKEDDTPEFSNVVKSIQNYGLRQPIVVRENNGYEIIDGEQRYKACLKLGFDNILVYNEGEVEDKKAKELTTWYQVQVPFDRVDLAYFITDLIQEHPDALIPYSEKEIEEAKKLANFDFTEYKMDITPVDKIEDEDLDVNKDGTVKIISIRLDQDMFNHLTEINKKDILKHLKELYE